ncbi:MAG: glycosyltransferase [Fimbriimonadales bacterium]|nr:glycosyltransferase [Fimbriimonadales bacterium]
MQRRRVLFGPVTSSEAASFRRALSAYDTLLFSHMPGADIQYAPQNTTFEQILAQLPSNWEPEVVLFWSPEYHPIPAGLERCPYRLVAALGDWNLGLWKICDALRMFDHILTDKRGVQVLQRLGFRNVSHAKLYGYNPDLHRRLPNEPKIYDVGFVGNLNPAVQGERARWLLRLARLGEKYKIAITTGLYGDDYTRFLNRCKITFNRSIRGEMNMRAYEAPACGSLLLYEADNLEVYDLYQNSVHCVLYDEQNLEQVIDHYLAYEAQRERIVETAWQHVQNYRYSEQYNRLIQHAIEAVPETAIGRARTFSELSDWEQTRARTHQCVQSSFAERAEAALAILSRCDSAASDPVRLNDEAVLCLLLASESATPSVQTDCLQRAEQCLQQAMVLEPAHAVAMMNYALLLYATGRHAELEGWAHRALKALPECSPALLRNALPWSPGYDWFRVESERAFAETGHDTAAFADRLRGFYAQKLCLILGELYARRDALHSAIHMYQRAFELHPQLAQPLAQMLCRLNRHGDAITWLERAIEREPLNLDYYVQLAPLLHEAGQAERLDTLCKDALLLIQACPHLQGYREFFERIAKWRSSE